MRLDKYLAKSSGLSRKEVKRLLHADEVSVNGEPERNPARHIKEGDEVSLNDRPMERPEPRYLMMNKPDGVVCANDDPTHPTVLALIELPRAEEMTIAGRLDIDATGLVLITDDGKWAHRATSPRHKTHKVYLVTTADPIPADAVDKFAKGIKLDSERFPTKPAELTLLSDNEARVVIHEGRYHQVKRMFAALGNRVVELHRESVGEIVLDDDLFPGEYRHLTEDEINSL
ncbi:16S rRNA pseudouridine(516) synthase RsuA [Marinobacterium lutimaris]|uniref:Pseudouridine synthase n=1 Tax=Marinobacterium lutimaris TaxID=568106 RepID=A0A1H6D517_9GAMM|nr:16S rRNA pseudouridine(516) synthase RsuA [Marinobacterium lutimaris]SEG80469.1 ribosomal small subunit pseudouridine synthase A [Marinobacterium lutimaris]